MDYKKIGQKIRKTRKQRGFSQEQLAEKVWISTTHMSHIETGSTKLSLPVLVDIAVALNVSTDYLVFDNEETIKTDAIKSAELIFEDCSPKQAVLISEIMKSAKDTMVKLEIK